LLELHTAAVEVCKAAEERLEYRGMGTTVVACPVVEFQRLAPPGRAARSGVPDELVARPLRRRMVRTMAGLDRGIVRRPIPFGHVKKLELQKPQD
jgi:hypothetical protein